ncbi:MAG: TldD/PmbA family protein [Candidatus Edwardsbacteria bacterium]
MIGEAKAKGFLKKALAISKAEQTEIILMCEDSYLTRFANSYIHQNVAEKNGYILVRAILGKKIGCASTNRLDEEAIKQTVKRATEIAHIQKENKDFKSLPAPTKPAKKLELFVEETARFSPKARAGMAQIVINQAEKNKVKAFGAISNGTAEVAIANSLGTMEYSVATDAFINIVIMSETGSGYAQAGSRDIKDIKIKKVAETAVEKAVRSQNPTEITPGEYTVILEEMAVAELLGFLGYLGFSALAVQEGRSFMIGKFGQKIMDEKITIVDDAYNTRSFSFPFDFEGVPKQRITLMENGIARNVVYDSMTADKEGKKSTGHALAAPLSYPLPLNIMMRGGNSTIEEMIANTEKGIYVTRFHYCNVIDPMQVTVTGMTRDGTFLIENGKISRPLKNLRFTESILSAFNQVSAISQKTTLVTEGNFYGGRFATGVVVPAMKIEKFNFSGVTEF